MTTSPGYADEAALVGIPQIAEIANVGRSAVGNWRKRHADFPTPKVQAPSGALFDLREVEDWLIEQGKISERAPASARLWGMADATRGVWMADEFVRFSVAFLVYLEACARARGDDTPVRGLSRPTIPPGTAWADLRTRPSGFALADDLAPVIFINGADTKAAQIFTLAHELAHIWLGQSALSDADMTRASSNAIERWCNRVAGEFLLPVDDLKDYVLDRDDLTEELEKLARRFKVSTLVALRRLYDANYLTESEYRQAFVAERERVLALMEEGEGGGGGNFYNTQPVRVGKRFARALIESTLEGQTLHRDAFQMLGFKKVSTFHELAARLGVA